MVALAASLMSLLLFLPATGLWAGEPVELTVQPMPTGGLKATASMVFSAEAGVIQQILTDYPHWPDLFDIRMRIVDLREQDGKTVTDIRIAHALIPGERRLVCESRALPEGGVLTELRGGDFKQYRRIWMLAPADGGRQTKAQFELQVQIETIVPDWLVAVAVRKELTAHFRMVQEKALAMTTRGK